MTTDTQPKVFAAELTIGGRQCRIGAMAKGSGMIHINMATMLLFLTTDAAITAEMLRYALSSVIKTTLNQVCVDGDTSTNDMAVLLANGRAGNPTIDAPGDDFDAFCGALERICAETAKAIAADGEGATKLLECTVTGAPDDATARTVAKTVIASNLLKAAMFGEDANWGRVLCAVGYAPGEFSVEHVSIALESGAGRVLVCRDSAHAAYDEEQAAAVLAEHEIRIKIDMGCGDGQGMAWGCDLTYDYVKINGAYRT
jgi:glutamate N-acetyltransferase/amino-acid N-acetyltransferase